MFNLPRGSMVARRGPYCPAFRAYFCAWSFIAFMTLVEGAEAVKVESAQADSLINIRTALNSLDPTLFRSWNKTNDCANWLGLKCDASGNVTSLIITPGDVLYPNGSTLALATYNSTEIHVDEYGNKYNGTLSDSVSNLKYLQTLILNDGGLHGQIPSTIGNLTKLKILILANQFFEGAIPESIGNLTQLVYLDVSANQFSNANGNLLTALNGTLPPELSKLANLEHLDLQECNFTGSPTFVKNFTKLVYLNLQNNPFNVALSDILGDFPDIQYLYLRGISSQNADEFPAIISAYSNLKVLSLVNASLTGSIRSSFNNLVKLEEMDLSENQITSILSNLSSLKNLKTLKLAANALISIDYVVDLTSLKTLEIQLNGLNGVLPDLSRLQSLEYLDANNNFFSGTVNNVVVGIPDYLAKFTNLTYLNLDSNSFGGNFPVSLTNLENLGTFSCAQCGLEGPMPPEITSMTALTYLDLHDNSLTGEIPDNIGELVNLETLDLSLNYLTGTIPASLKDTAISDLRLNNNLLVGNITNSLVTNVEILWLHSNNFTGPIPSEIGSLASLSDILFQYNNLTNEIPPELFNINATFINLDLSGNNLGGVIPREISKFGENISSLILSGCGLGGELPADISSLVNLDILDLSKNNFVGLLPNLENLTKLRDLSLNNNSLTFDVSSLPPSPLEKLDIGSFGSGFDGLPNFPSSYNLSLLTLGLQSNNISGEIPSGYFDGFELLQAVFLQNNKITGDIASIIKIPKENHIEFIDLSNNTVTLASESLSGAKITLDLSDNPLCQKSEDPYVLNFCRSSENVLDDFVAPNKCNVSCSSAFLPNPYLFENANLCVCSKFVFVALSFSPTPLAYISNRCLRDIEDWVSDTIGILSSQVRVMTANFTTGDPLSLVFYLQIFSTTEEAPGSNVLVPLRQLSRLEAPFLGTVDFVRILPIKFDHPSSSPTVKHNKSDESGLKPWLIAIIVILAFLAVVVVFLLACLFYRRNGKSSEDQNPILKGSTVVEGNRQYVQFKAEA